MSGPSLAISPVPKGGQPLSAVLRWGICPLKLRRADDRRIPFTRVRQTRPDDVRAQTPRTDDPA